MVRVEDVKVRWIVNGIGHMMLFEFEKISGPSPDIFPQFVAPCGLEGDEGFRTEVMPDELCEDCAYLVETDPELWRMMGYDEEGEPYE